jgi:hypothetical protein
MQDAAHAHTALPLQAESGAEQTDGMQPSHCGL